MDHEKKSTQNLTNPPPPPAAANSSSTMVDFSKSEVIDIIERRIDDGKLQENPTFWEPVIRELEKLRDILTNPHPPLPVAANSILTMVDSANRDAILQIDSRIVELKEDPTTNKEVIRQLNRLRETVFRFYKEEVFEEKSKTKFDDDDFEEMMEKTRLVSAIVDLLSFPSPEHSLFNPDMLVILPDGDPMLLLTKNDLASIHQFDSKPVDYSEQHIMHAISSFCIKAKWWLARNPGVNDLSVSLNKIISVIDNPEDKLKKDAATNFETPEMEKLSADNGQQSNSQDRKRLKKSDEQEKNSVKVLFSRREEQLRQESPS